MRGSDYSLAIALSEEKDLVTENWSDRKSNDGLNKNEQPDSGIHNTLTHSSCLYYFQHSMPDSSRKNVRKNLNV